ncbi:hypothetical protein MtrunA17_Chr8g0350171 [Medicago truncatula]|uniref:Uncharacterized protein n=1 Tax=Medicago truncatula TaxID=3880 RepID=A0A072TP28_MEDTR|nr:hypothetical protein MTR_8g032325 [Medicago truncatula]RHN40017.1 hypothetical protein MtrunA17_Chr8g0350171 [Medicago truncatula]
MDHMLAHVFCGIIHLHGHHNKIFKFNAKSGNKPLSYCPKLPTTKHAKGLYQLSYLQSKNSFASPKSFSPSAKLGLSRMD